MNESMEAWGWNPFFDAQTTGERTLPGRLARIVAEHRTLYEIAGAEGAAKAELSGRLKAEAEYDVHVRPVVGDWVELSLVPGGGHARIERVFERRGVFVRRAPAARGGVQPIVANVDVAILATSLNQEFNPRRLERYLALAAESGADPVVALTKADLHPDPEHAAAEVERACGVCAVALSAVSGSGLDALAAWLTPGATAVLLGSSGVGKSTLVNRLLGSAAAEVRSIGNDDKGRHTTTARQMHRLPGGALLIDTPGMRELGLAEGGGIGDAFQDVEALALQCRFRDCRHQAEPGCAVRAALEGGQLELGRWSNFEKLRRETAFQERQADPQLALNVKRRWKQIHKAQKLRRKLDDS
ncbi:MAG: ribosome small subunit-dependent GTPase A [Planctomycetes bacterium]|nr:ribosome small subunit-dependent GTPase A [Planctomycetota bacterium]